jgi:hypothetical protein
MFIYGFLTKLFNCIGYKVPNDRMAVKKDLKLMWKKMDTEYFKVLC